MSAVGRSGHEASRTAAESSVRRVSVVAVGILVVFMVVLNISLVALAIPTINRTFGASSTQQQWLVSGYFLTLGTALMPAGRFGDARGRRNIFVAGTLLFVVASGVAGLAPSMGWLIIARLFQGLAAGMVTPQVYGMIQVLFAPDERARPLGWHAAGVVSSRVVGPPLGGVLLTTGGPEHGWRWIFLVNIPIGVVAAVWGWRLIPTVRRAERPDLDPVGALLLIAGLVLLWLMQGELWGPFLRWLLLLPVGLGALVGFVVWEQRYVRQGQPLFDPRLLRLRSFALGTFVATFYFAGYNAIFYVLSKYLQEGLGHDGLEAGLALTPLALGVAVTSFFAATKTKWVGRPLVILGLVLGAIGLAALAIGDAFLPGPDSPHAAALPLLLSGLGGGLVVTGVGAGLVIAPNQTLTLSEVPSSEGGSAGGMLQTGQQFGGGLGVAVAGSALLASLGSTGNWLTAFRVSWSIIVGFLVVALVASLIDLYYQAYQVTRTLPPGCSP
ncbi:MFS transporter [Micromonospora sp. WMMA1363]|uniref:MFS transporter n=1 Tax=Micromonospora sp. WMMA1363 TaxID=3053985 RepID=UPI00259CBAB0|nr:MFS transporter [Micromonospora sp. WMMA1363]MDM4718714.1 MFS transporter [Micromonospora sp. WMMA1363]